MEDPIIVLAGATGDLGGRIAASLLERGVTVRALVRAGNSPDPLARLRQRGAEIVEVDFGRTDDPTRACSGASCVVSALSGLRDVIVDTQARLLDAPVRAGVPRFIPSDFAIDFAKLPPGGNRNLDLRREFQQRLDGAPIAATSILNGMFPDLLTGQAPVILFPLRRVVFWEDPDQRMDFTTAQDTGEFTAAAALDPSTPRWLRVAGDQQSARGLADVASDVTGRRFRLFRAGGLGRLRTLIKITRALVPDRGAVFPPWQGMQYLHDMFSGLPKLEPLDNRRYPDLRWTSVREVLEAR